MVLIDQKLVFYVYYRISTPFESVNLKAINTLKNTFNTKVSYSDIQLE